MSNKNSDTTLTGANARQTFDKGLGYEKMAKEKIFIYDRKGKVQGVTCDRYNQLPEDILTLDTKESRGHLKNELERQLQVLNAGLISLHYTSTSCLLKAAGSFNQLLLLYIQLQDEKRTRYVSETLLDIFAEVEKRTRKPYQFQILLNQDMFRPLPPEILNQYPLNKYSIWKESSKRKITSVSKGKKTVKEDGLIPIVEKKEKPVDQKDLDNAIEAATANIKIASELAKVAPGDTPLLNQYLANLTKISLEDVYKQTKFRLNIGDWKLSDLVEITYFASAMTLVLDKNGEPIDGNGIYGLFRYGMILPSRKFKTVRFIPPPGKYVSLGPMAGQQFMFEGGIIRKLPIQYNGILGYQEIDVTGQWVPDYQEQANEVLGRNKVYMGSLVIDSAFSPKDISITSMISNLPDVVEDTMPYFFILIKKKAKNWFENYEDLLKEIAEEVLKNIIIETLKQLAIKYVVKKIGKKIIPVINAIAAAKDAVDAISGKDTERDTIAINCVRLYMKGLRQDDRTLAVKILANIMGDEFENEIKSAIIKHASSIGLKMVNRVTDRSKPAPVPTSAEPPKALPEPAKEPASTPPVSTATQDKKPGDTDVINQGWKAFHETRKEQEDQRGTEKKGTTRPEEVKTEDPGQKKVHHEEEEKKSKVQKPAAKQQEKHSDEDRELVNRTENKEEHKGGEKKEPPKKGEGENTSPRKGDNKKPVKGSKEEEEKENESGKSSNTPVKSYPPLEVFTNTTQSKFRRKLVAFFKRNPNHPLKEIYNSTTKRLQPSTRKGMDTFYWEEHPEAVQAGHVRSKHTGTPDQVIIMTAAENQSYSNTIESKGASIKGGFKVAIIEGLPISVQSAKHLISYGKLKQSDLDNATIVDVDDL
jgi:DNA polymerase III gamma/tau subunit